MEEIKVGEYVRTKDGRIIKFNKFGTLRVGCTNPKYYKTIISNRSHYKYDDIVKHSLNIVDLIEVGDYVNGNLVDNNTFDLFINSDWKERWGETIETVVTKEQFEENSYKVGD